MKSRISILLLGVVSIGSLFSQSVYSMVSSEATSAIIGQDSVKATVLAHTQKPTQTSQGVFSAVRGVEQQTVTSQPQKSQKPATVDSKEHKKSLVARVKGYFEQKTAADAFKKIDKKYPAFEKAYDLSQKECELFESELEHQSDAEAALCRAMERHSNIDTALLEADKIALDQWCSTAAKMFDRYNALIGRWQRIAGKLVDVYSKKIDNDNYAFSWLKQFDLFAQSEGQERGFAFAKTQEMERRLRKAMAIMNPCCICCPSAYIRSLLSGELMLKTAIRGGQVSRLLLAKYEDIFEKGTFRVAYRMRIAASKRLERENRKLLARVVQERRKFRPDMFSYYVDADGTVKDVI